MTVRQALDYYLILGILSTFSNIAIQEKSRKEILLQSMLISFICLFGYCAAANKNTTSFQSLFLTCHARQQHNTNYNYLIEVR